MVALVFWTLVALAAAALVLVVASVADTRSQDGGAGIRGYLQDLRAGVRTLHVDRRRRSDRPTRPTREARRAAEDDDDSSLEDFFAATEVQAPAYVAVEDLTETLARARDRAARGVQGLARR